MHSGILGLVIEIKPNGKKGVTEFFEMSKIGKAAIEKCSRKKDCITTEQHDSCSEEGFYQSASHKVIFDDFFSLTVKNFMQIRIVEKQPKNDIDFREQQTMTPEEPEEQENNYSSQDTTEINSIQCKNLSKCKTKSTKILMHLSKSKQCRETYSEEELAKLEALRDRNRKAYKRKMQKGYDEENAEIKKAKQSKYNKDNAKKIAQSQSQYNKKNFKKIVEKQSVYDKKNAPKVAEKQSKYNKKNAKNIAEKQSVYDKKNASQITEKQSQYNKKNASQLKEKQSQYNKKNASQIKEKQSQYNKKNATKIAEKQKDRRDIVKKNRTQEDRLQVFNRDIIDGPNYVCYSCNRCLFKNGVKLLKIQDISKLFSKADKGFL